MRKTLLAVLVAGFALAAAPAYAGQSGFDGSCDATGITQFLPPGGLLPAVTEDEYIFNSTTGSCTGQLSYDGQPVGASQTYAVSIVAGGHGRLSCAANALPGGEGYIQFLDASGEPLTAADGGGVYIRFGFDAFAVANQIALHLQGGTDATHPVPTQATGKAEFTADEALVNGCIAANIGQLEMRLTAQTGPSPSTDPTASQTVLLDRGTGPAPSTKKPKKRRGNR
jgi:hypothetical protein